MVSDVSSTMMDERHGNHTTPTPYSAYDLGRNGTHWNNHMVFDPWWPDSYPNQQLLLRPGGQETHDIGAHFHGDSSAFPSLARSSHEVPLPYPIYSNNQNISEPFISHHVPPHQSFGPSLPHRVAHPDSRTYSTFYHPPRQGSTGPARRRRPARAIEYDGRWIDEAELLQGLTEPNGNISVHQCRWEEDRSLCHLWVKGDKSCINVHIQKWHGGKPGGDKLKTDCRWSDCGMIMLKESIARHVVSIHLGEMWGCQGCEKEIVRNDAYGRHAVRSNFGACRTSGALITYSADARVVNVRAALDGGGRLRYAGA